MAQWWGISSIKNPMGGTAMPSKTSKLGARTANSMMWLWTQSSRLPRLCLWWQAAVCFSQSVGMVKESSVKPYQMLTLPYEPSSHMKAYSVHNNRGTQTTCGLWAANNSLNQTHYRKLEKLPVSKHMFVVPTNHLSVQAHKQTDARGRKSGPRALLHWTAHSAVDSPVTATALKPGQGGKAGMLQPKGNTEPHRQGQRASRWFISQEDIAEF